MNRDLFMSLDLEMDQPSGKIIQVGAVVGNLATGEIMRRLDLLVKIDEPLNPFIVKLTGITDQMLQERGVTLPEAYAQLAQAVRELDTDRNPITWGGGDSEELREQLGIAQEDYVFGRRWRDTKTLYQAWAYANGLRAASGLSKSMHRLGLQFVGKKHYAPNDAENTFKAYRELVGKFKTAKELT
jgi:inhibitor of KinA sporulation pathway (predicted exonuclease)